MSEEPLKASAVSFALVEALGETPSTETIACAIDRARADEYKRCERAATRGILAAQLEILDAMIDVLRKGEGRILTGLGRPTKFTGDLLKQLEATQFSLRRAEIQEERGPGLLEKSPILRTP